MLLKILAHVPFLIVYCTLLTLYCIIVCVSFVTTIYTYLIVYSFYYRGREKEAQKNFIINGNNISFNNYINYECLTQNDMI